MTIHNNEMLQKGTDFYNVTRCLETICSQNNDTQKVNTEITMQQDMN